MPFWLLGAVALLLPACESDGHFTLLGYSTVPNYDPNIRTVYVPIFQNRTNYRGIEFQLTQAVIREIEAKTPFKVVHQCETADTELLGTIAVQNKAILNRNQQNLVREAELLLTVEVLWRDRRTGEVLSGPGRRLIDAPAPMQVPAMMAQPVAGVGLPGTPPADGLPPGAVPIDPTAPKPVPPALVSSYSTFVPELGESIATGQKIAIDRLAVQIVSMMEMPW
jgi:hypothetical protein